MKKLLLGFLMLFAFSAFAQDPSLPIDMEDPADDAWVGESGSVYSLETALFSPNTAGKIVGGTDQWNSRVDLALGTYIDMTTPSKTFTFEFYTTEAVEMTGLFQISLEEDGGFPIEMQFTTDGFIGWETITLDFTNADNGYPNCQTCPDPQPVVYGQYAQVSIFTNFGDIGTSTYYFDDIAGAANGAVVGADPLPAAPPTPQPTAAAEDVISVFSDVYTDLSNFWHPGWGQTTVYSKEIIPGTSPEDSIVKLKNLTYDAVLLAGVDNPTNVASMDSLHIDIWSIDDTPVRLYLLAGPEPFVSLPLVANQWNSFDIPLVDFIGADLTAFWAIKFESGNWAPGSSTLVYFDNIYFWREPVVAGTDATLSDLQVEFSSIPGFAPSIVNYTYGLPEGTVTVPQITAAIPTDPGVTGVVTTQAPAIPGDATVLVTAGDGVTTLTYTVSFVHSIPNSLPPLPTQDPADVFSIYSDTYTDLAGTNFNPWWGQATIVTIDDQIAGNNTLKYANLNYQGTNLGSVDGGVPQDVSGYEFLHVDFWTYDATVLNFFIIDQSAGEVSYSLPITSGQWVSVDIPLSHYSDGGENLTDIHQFKVDGPTATVWFDNWYFWKSPSSDWTGAVDSNWDDAGNWSDGVPTALLNATIPDVGANPYPVITASADANNIYVATAATLTIAPGGDLTTAGEVDVDGNFYMSSDASGVSASFIEQGVTGGGTFYFDRDLFCSGSNPANEADPFGWHYLSAPINGLTTDDLLDYYVNQWDEVGNVWMNFEGTAPCIPYATEYLDDVEAWSLNLDTEYDCPAPGTGSVIEFSGPFSNVHTGGFSTPVTASGGSFSGWNMIGNPYPSAIDPANFDWTGFDNGTNGVAIYEGCTGNYLYSNLGNGYSYKVGPTQGFFMLTSGATDFALDGSERVHDNGTTIYKDAVANLLTIEATGDGTSDLAYIRFMDDSQSGMDKADFPKLISTTEGLAQIYTTSGEDMLAVNALPATPIVPMGFTSVTTGEYTISAIEANDFSNVVLEDRFTGVQTDLLNDSYTFNYTVSDDANRFFVHFTPLGIGDNAAASINIWSSDHNIYVQTPEINGDIVVFNMMGQEVTRTQVEAGVNVIPVSEVNAFYVVKIVGSDVAKTGKVYVK